MKFMKLCYFLLHFFCLPRHELETGQVSRSMLFNMVITKFSCKRDYNGKLYNFNNIIKTHIFTTLCFLHHFVWGNERFQFFKVIFHKACAQILKFLKMNFTDQSPCWETVSLSASQKITSLLWSSVPHYSIHKRPTQTHLELYESNPHYISIRSSLNCAKAVGLSLTTHKCTHQRPRNLWMKAPKTHTGL